jgi:multiple sugar transport system permease protein
VKHKTQKSLRYYRRPLLWLSPMLLLILVFYLYPLFDVIRLSFTNTSLLYPGDYAYTLASYVELLQNPRFAYTMRITFIYVISTGVLQIGLGNLIAMILDTSTRRYLRGTIVTRTVVLSAWMVPGVLVGIVWRMVLSSGSAGILNYLFEAVGIDRVPFLVNPSFALMSVIAASVWRGTAFSMILQYAGLQRIPREIYEVADVDGASALQKYFHITLPQLRPIMFVNLVLISINQFNTFDMVQSLTGGGPANSTELLTLSAYNQVFKVFNLGRGAAIAAVLLLVNLVMAIFYYRIILAGRERADD